MDADEIAQERQHIRSSLVREGIDIPELEHTALAIAREMRTLNADEDQWVIDAMMDMITLISPNLTLEQAQRWSIVAIGALSRFPASIVGEAIQAGMGECEFPSRVVPFITTYVELARGPMVTLAAGVEQLLQIAQEG